MAKMKLPLFWPVVMGGKKAPYKTRMLALFQSSMIAYWPMDELTGTTADNAEGTAARDGTYVGVTLGQPGIGDGSLCPLFDGVTSVNKVFSASLQTAMGNSAVGTLALWMKVANAGIWTDGAQHRAFHIDTWGGGGSISITKITTNGVLRFYYKGGGVEKLVDKASMSNPGWMHVELTWSVAADEVKAYYNGAQEGSTLNTISAWGNTIQTNLANIGAGNIAPAEPWSGYLAHVILLNRAATPAEVAQMAAA